jgi:hypothetical protein
MERSEMNEYDRGFPDFVDENTEIWVDIQDRTDGGQSPR